MFFVELIFKQQTIQLDNTSSPENIITEINTVLEKGYYFSHFIADGAEVYENHEQYLEQYANQIKELEVIAKTEKEFVNDLLLPSLAEAFYDNPTQETWTRLEDFLGGLQWFDEMLMVIGKSEAVPVNWTSYLEKSSKMQEEISNLLEAMKNEDNILIGDIIQYELLSNFEVFDVEIKKTIDSEGTRYDLS